MVRSGSGVLVLAVGFKCFNVSMVVEAEARAMLKKIQVAGNRGLSSLLVESDYLSLVNLCCDRVDVRSDLGNIIHDIIVKSDAYDVVSFTHIHRLSNYVVHSLAKWALEYNSFTV
ncbi:hypothetical protein ACOSQ3_002453 [Xanthoceras sorbifolium]